MIFSGYYATSLVVGAFHSCALRHDGSVVCWGYNTDGQLGIGTKLNVSAPVQPVNPRKPVILGKGEPVRNHSFVLKRTDIVRVLVQVPCMLRRRSQQDTIIHVPCAVMLVLFAGDGTDSVNWVSDRRTMQEILQILLLSLQILE